MACAAVCGVSTSLPSFIHGTSRVENAVPVISFLLMCAWLVRPEEAPPGDEMRFVSAPRFALLLELYQRDDSVANLGNLLRESRDVLVRLFVYGSHHASSYHESSRPAYARASSTSARLDFRSASRRSHASVSMSYVRPSFRSSVFR